MTTFTPRPRASATTLLLREAGSSPAAVASLMGVSVQAVSHWLGGRRRAPADLEDALTALVGEDVAGQVLALIPDTAGTQGSSAILHLLDSGMSLGALADELAVEKWLVRLYLDGIRPAPAALAAALSRLAGEDAAATILAAIPGYRPRRDIA